MEWTLLIIFATSAAIAWLITPTVIRIAGAIGAIDLPNERKVHTQPMPRLGGLALFAGFFGALLVLAAFGAEYRPLAALGPWKGSMLLLSLLIVLALGIADDRNPLPAGRKFVVQLGAACLLYVGGFRISSVTHLLEIETVSLGLLDIPVTLMWIVGVTNAFNLIDGLDGLAAGVGVIASLTIGVISFINNDFVPATLSVALAGSLAGFLRHNFNPARIFLGDSGSLFLGILLAVLSIQSSTKGSTAFAIAVPILALGLPIMDTIIAMVRRFLRSLLPETKTNGTLRGSLASVFLPDRRHIHHQLVALGLSHRNVVVILYLASCLFGLGAFAVTISNSLTASFVLVCVALATVAGIRQLRYREMAILRNGILLPIYDKPVWNRSLFLGFLDTALIAVAFMAAYAVSPPEGVAAHNYPGFRTLLPLVCGIQQALLYVFGLYRGTIRPVGLGDFLRLLKSVTLTGVLAGLILSFLPATRDYVSPQFLIIDFYFLLTCIALVRISLPALQFLFKQSRDGDKRVLIYGAESEGLIALQKILDTPSLRLKPLGFLDDNPQLEGKYVNGFPVYGNHWRLRAVLKRFPVDQILVAGDDHKPENLSRLQSIAMEHGIGLKRPVLTLEEVPSPPPRRRMRRIERVEQLEPVQ